MESTIEKDFETMRSDVLDHIKTISEEETLVNAKICAECGGQCCKMVGCILSPDDLPAESLKDIDSIRTLLLSGKYSIDGYYDDDSGRILYFIRMRNKYAPVVDRENDGAACCMWTKNGCKYSFKKRPTEGRLLIPASDGMCDQRITKFGYALLWYPYSDTLKELYDEFLDDPHMGIPKQERSKILFSNSPTIPGVKKMTLYTPKNMARFFDDVMVVEYDMYRMVLRRDAKKGHWWIMPKGCAISVHAYKELAVFDGHGLRYLSRRITKKSMESAKKIGEMVGRGYMSRFVNGVKDRDAISLVEFIMFGTRKVSVIPDTVHKLDTVISSVACSTRTDIMPIPKDSASAECLLKQLFDKKSSVGKLHPTLYTVYRFCLDGIVLYGSGGPKEDRFMFNAATSCIHKTASDDPEFVVSRTD